MGKQKYETSKLEFGTLAEATKEQLMEILRLANENRVISLTDLILKIVGKYGEEVWDLLTDQEYATGLRRAEIFLDLMKTSGDDRFYLTPV